jgi:hypothetical protein
VSDTSGRGQRLRCFVSGEAGKRGDGEAGKQRSEEAEKCGGNFDGKMRI